MGQKKRVNSSASPSAQSKSMGSLGPGNGSWANIYKADKGQIMANSNSAIVLYYIYFMYTYMLVLYTHNKAKSIKRSRAIEPSLLQRGRCHIRDAVAKVSSVRPWLYTHQLEKMSFKFNTGCTSKNLSQPRHWLLLSLAAIPACRRRPFLSMYLRTSPSADPGRERRASLERCPPDTAVARWQRNNK